MGCSFKVAINLGSPAYHLDHFKRFGIGCWVYLQSTYTYCYTLTAKCIVCIKIVHQPILNIVSGGFLLLCAPSPTDEYIENANKFQLKVKSKELSFSVLFAFEKHINSNRMHYCNRGKAIGLKYT